MKKVKNIVAVSAFSLMVLALSTVASAQWGNNNPNYPNYPNGGYSGAYGGRLEGIADRLKDRSRDLERQIDREFRNNNGRYNNTGSILGDIFGSNGNRGFNSNRVKQLAEDFRKAANEFESRVDDDDRGRNGRWNDRDNRDNQAAQRMLDIGSRLGSELRRVRISSTLQYQWNAIRNDLNLVANAYNNNRGGRNNRYPF